jgi:hypothetical protein
VIEVLATALTAAALSAPGEQAHRVAVSISRDGPRPAAGRLERRAHTRMARREMMGRRVDWQRDTSTGNSDHREFELAGMRAVKLGTLDNPCRHTACDRPARLEQRTFALAVRVVRRALRHR